MQQLLQWRSINIAYSECFYVALIIKNAILMRRIVEQVRIRKKERKMGWCIDCFEGNCFILLQGLF